MTICNMTIILKIRKYDNLQYDNYFEKIVVFEFQNMINKQKTYGSEAHLEPESHDMRS